MRIAIVDDNHTDRIFLREGLERILLKRNIENSEIHIFNSAEDILEYLKNEQETFFDLIFMDIYMEKLTGVDAAREIRKKDKKVKIVFITTSNEFASESYEVRAEDYLIKPYDKTRLENVMDRIFSEKKDGKILELKDGRKIIIHHGVQEEAMEAVQPETQEVAVEIVLQKIQEVSHLQVQKTKVAKLKKMMMILTLKMW